MTERGRGRIARQAGRLLGRAIGRLAAAATTRSRSPASPPRSGPASRAPAGRRSGTPPVDVEYRPRDDGRADPGEVVWAWVPYDEGDGRGKDRPVLVIGRQGDDLVGLQLSSQDHDLDAEDEARHGRSWMDIGSGAWDREGRPSEVRLDRLLVLDPRQVRREGAALDRRRFDAVVTAARRVQGW
jgi:hypothetical protein